jgi:type IV secretion system protein VirB9
MFAEKGMKWTGTGLTGILLAASVLAGSPGFAQDAFEEEVFGPTDAPAEEQVAEIKTVTVEAENPVEEPENKPAPAKKPATREAKQPAATVVEVEVEAKGAPAPKAPDQVELTRNAVEVWENRTGVVTPGPDGRVVYVFGQSIPTLVCQPGMACLVELEPGEEVLDTPVQSDTVRWQAELRHRDGDTPQTYFAFKPSEDAPDQANFFIFTDRRVYSIKLIKDLFHSTPILSFDYPDTRAQQLAKEIEERKQQKVAKAAAAKKARAAKTAKTGVTTTKGTVPADELDFKYSLRGRAPFKPTRVYNDGRKTYVDLPDGYRGDLPVVIGGKAEANRAFNYRTAKNGKQIIIDKVLNSFELQNGRQIIRVRRGS